MVGLGKDDVSDVGIENKEYIRTIRLLTKCEYESLDKPCNYCKERCFQCGANEKVLGPKNQQIALENAIIYVQYQTFALPRYLSLDKDEALTELDLFYLRETPRLQRGRIPMSRTSMFLTRPNGTHCFGFPTMVTMNVIWPGFTLNSKASCFAALAVAAQRMREHPHTVAHTVSYLHKCWGSISKAIDSQAIFDVAVASYIMVLFTYISIGPYDALLFYFTGLRAAYIQLKQNPTHLAESYLDTLFNDALRMLHRVFWMTSPWLGRLQKFERDLLDRTFIAVRDTNKCYSIGGTINNTRARFMILEGLNCCRSFYLDYYLALMTHGTRDPLILDSVRESLLHILKEITTLVPQLPNQLEFLASVFPKTESGGFMDYPPIAIPPHFGSRDINASICHSTCLLLEQMLHSNDRRDSEAVAISLCRLIERIVTSPFDNITLIYPLLWSSLVLTKSTNPKGGFCNLSEANNRT